MKQLTIIIIALLASIANDVNAKIPKADTIKTNKGDLIIQPIFHGSLVLMWNNKTIYIDPYNGVEAYKGLPTPDHVLITDIHGDHLDQKTLDALNTSKAKLIVPQAVADKLPSQYAAKVIVMNNDSKKNIGEIPVKAIAMYNLPEAPDAMHTKGRGNGYILELGNKTVYISGDTEDIPEIRALKHIDIAFVCMNQPYTMTVEQAASAVLEFKPKIVYPYHYRNKDGFSDTQEFSNLVYKDNKYIDVRLRDWYGK